jgi:hypothetical protein
MRAGHLPAPLRRFLARVVATPPGLKDTTNRAACIYKVDRLGDFIVATGAIRALANHHGPENCRLVVSDIVAPLAAAEFPTVPRWELPAAAAGLWRDVRPLRRDPQKWRTESFGQLISLRHQPNLYRDVTLSWIHAQTWAGLGPRPAPARLAMTNRPCLPSGYPTAQPIPWSRELAAHQIVISRAVGREVSWDEIRPALNSVVVTRGDHWLFSPFGSEKSRDYPMDKWEVAWRQARITRAPVQVIGTPDRRDNLLTVADRLRAAGFGQVTVETNVSASTFMQRIGSARGVVTVESAAAHIATALDKRVVVVMGGGHHGWFAPWGEQTRQKWVTETLPCFGCGWDCQFDAIRCLDVSPSLVSNAMDAVLS